MYVKMSLDRRKSRGSTRGSQHRCTTSRIRRKRSATGAREHGCTTPDIGLKRSATGASKHPVANFTFRHLQTATNRITFASKVTASMPKRSRSARATLVQLRRGGALAMLELPALPASRDPSSLPPPHPPPSLHHPPTPAPPPADCAT